MLASTLDYDRTLQTVAELSVPGIRGLVHHRHHRRRREHSSAEGRRRATPGQAILRERVEQIAIDRSRPYILRRVFETRRSLLVAQLSPEYLERTSQGPEHLELIREVDPKSLMAVPLLMRGELFGALAFISSRPDRAYDTRDLRLAEALAERAAVAIENATSYRAAVEATKVRDQVLRVVAHDLRNPLQVLIMQANLLPLHGRDAENESAESVEVIRHAASRMDRLIRDLLDVTTIEGDQLLLTQTRVAGAPIVHNSIRAAAPLAAAASRRSHTTCRRAYPTCGPIETASCKCSKTSSATRSSSPSPVVGSPLPLSRPTTT